MSAGDKRLVLIDRDGVINRDSASYIKSVEEWVPLPGSLEAIAGLTRAGFDVAVITNQSGVGRGLFSETTLAEIHAAMCRAADLAGGRIAGVYYCPHRPDERCACRKPKPKLLLDAAADFGVSPENIPYIGDKATDVEAAKAAGARPILISADPGTRSDVETFPDLAGAARQLLREAGAA